MEVDEVKLIFALVARAQVGVYDGNGGNFSNRAHPPLGCITDWDFGKTTDATLGSYIKRTLRGR